MGVVWLTPAMEDSTPRSVRRSINTQPSFTLQGTGQEDLPAAEVSTASVTTMPNWQASLGYPSKKTLKKTIEMTTQLCAEPVEMEIREIPRQHRKKRLLPLHPSRLKGRVDIDTFFSSIQSIRGYKCVQLFVHVPSDYLFVRCMQRESHSHGAYQDFVREIGAPEIVATDNSQTQTGTKWEETSRKNVTKQRKFSPHNQNQNKAERRIQDVKHKIVYILERADAPIKFWCYALIHVVDCLNHHAKPALNWKTSTELLNGDTPDISAFRFSFWQAIEYYEPTAKFPEARWKAGRFLGIAWESGDAFTFKIWTEKDGWSEGRELTRNIVRARRVLPLTKITHDDDTDSFYFQRKVYSNKRRGKNRDRVYSLVRIENQIEDAISPAKEEQHLSHDDYTVPKPSEIPLPESNSNPIDIYQEEKELETDIANTESGSDEIISNPTHTTKKIDCASNDIEQPHPSHIAMVDEVNDQFTNLHENPSFGGSGVLGILSHAWRHGQLTLKVEWSGNHFVTLSMTTHIKLQTTSSPTMLLVKSIEVIEIFNGLKRLYVICNEHLEDLIGYMIFPWALTITLNIYVAPERKNLKQKRP